MSNEEEARKWLQLAFETYGLEGMLQVATVMGFAPHRDRRLRNSQWSRRHDQAVSLAEVYSERHPKAWPYRDGDQLAIASPACVERCYHILERPLPFPGSDKNTSDFHKCVNECMGLG